MRAVYRLEDADGRGAYTSMNEAVRAVTSRHRGYSGARDFEKHPAPRASGIRFDDMEADGGRIFGFPTLAALQAWFTPRELIDLQDAGLQLRRYFVDGPLFGDHRQVCFSSNTARSLKKGPTP